MWELHVLYDYMIFDINFQLHLVVVPASATLQAAALHQKEIIAKQLMEIATVIQFAIIMVTVVKMCTVLQVIHWSIN